MTGSVADYITDLEQENKDLKVLLEVVNQKNIREGENTFNLVKYYRNENETLKDNINHLQAIIDDGRAENKRFREENEELKKQIESDKGLITVGGKQQYEYLQRIDELKKTVENQKLEYEELQCDLSEVENACGCYQSENAELKQENKELKEKAPMKLIAKNNKYRSALEEIRSIIIDDNSILVDKKDYIELQCGEPIAFKLQKIFNKINEVLS